VKARNAGTFVKCDPRAIAAGKKSSRYRPYTFYSPEKDMRQTDPQTDELLRKNMDKYIGMLRRIIRK